MKYLIIGGTGTLGKAVIKKLLSDHDPLGVNEITSFSRSELNQKKLLEEFNHHPRLRCILGDIRDLDSLLPACSGIDTVFHLAALKHIDLIEDNPEESVRINILGTMNVAESCIFTRVKWCIFSSTDKAVEPVNVYGMCKGLAEKLLLHKNKSKSDTRFSVFRWGNVIASRGSVIPYFIKTLQNESKVYLTHPEMTRFWIRVDDAVDFMLSSYNQNDEVKIPKIRSAPVKQVIDCLAEILNIPHYQTEITGLRPGERLHEKLNHDLCSNYSNPMSSDELKSMLTPIVKEFV